MRLGLNMSYWGAGNDASNLELAVEAERLGFSVVWAAEAYGSDAPTVLSWVAAKTTAIDVGSAVMQIPARTPAMTAMTAATLDILSAGRFRLGLGVSGPQVSEGWHGVRFAKPLGRTREYVEIVRQALSGERVRHDGEHYRLPLPDGPGKALQLTVHGARQELPIYLASVGPHNLELTGEIADGWLGTFCSPLHLPTHLAQIASGRAKVGRNDLSGFDVAPVIPLVTGEDWRRCADATRSYTALYVGGMGSREKNFYNQLATAMGYGEAAAKVQEAYLDRRYDEAMATLPLELLDEVALLGTVPRIAERMTALAEAGATTLNIAPPPGAGGVLALRTAAEALDQAGLGK